MGKVLTRIDWQMCVCVLSQKRVLVAFGMRACLQGPQQRHSRPTIRYKCQTWRLAKDSRMERTSKPKDLVEDWGGEEKQAREGTERAKCGLVLYFHSVICMLTYLYMYLLGELPCSPVWTRLQQRYWAVMKGNSLDSSNEPRHSRREMTGQRTSRLARFHTTAWLSQRSTDRHAKLSGL